MSDTIEIPRLKAKYNDEIRDQLQKDLGLGNVMQVPRLEKIVVNMGVGGAVGQASLLENAIKDLTLITGQKPLTTRARKSIANFKLRQGQIVGCHVTLRGDSMWEFLQRLIAVALPTIRDFRGVAAKLDGQGNYNLGITDHTIFPEITVENVKKHMGLDLTIVTSAKSDDEGRELLRLIGIPFRRVESATKAA